MRCKFCSNRMTDLTRGYGEGRNYICSDPNCSAHLYSPIISFMENVCSPEKWYTKREWEETYGQTETSSRNTGGG